MNRSREEWMRLWIIGSMAGWATAWAVNVLLSFVFRLSGSLDRLLYDQPFVGYAIFGVCVGVVQWRVALRGVLNGTAWAIALGIASILLAASFVFASSHQLLPPILQYRNLGCLSASCDSYILRSTWLSGIAVLGVIGGLSVAIPTSCVLALSRHGARVHIWVLGCLLASFLGLLAYLPFILLPGPILCSICFVVIVGPLVIAAISAPFFRLALQEPMGLQK
jgi:hypothetical protein